MPLAAASGMAVDAKVLLLEVLPIRAVYRDKDAMVSRSTCRPLYWASFDFLKTCLAQVTVFGSTFLDSWSLRNMHPLLLLLPLELVSAQSIRTAATW